MNTKIKYILSFIFLFSLWNCKQSEESKIKETCNRFIEGRKALIKGDSLKLKSVVGDSLFRLIMLNEQYFQMLDAAKIRADLEIHPVSVEITNNCATCLMSGSEHYRIHLCKDGENWEVKGENDIYPTSERLAEAKKKLADYKEFLKNRPEQYLVIKVVNTFFDQVKIFFKDGESAPLQESCDDASIDFIERLCTYAKKRTGADVLTEEMDKYNLVMGDISFKNGHAIFKFFQEDTTFVNLKKDGDSYIITGFNGIDSKDITNQVIRNKYLAFLRAVKLTRSEQYRDKMIK